jgi:hypothetical protein
MQTGRNESGQIDASGYCKNIPINKHTQIIYHYQPYTSFEDLKASKNSIQPQQSDSERESDLKDFVAFLKTHSSTPEHLESCNSQNSSNQCLQLTKSGQLTAK